MTTTDEGYMSCSLDFLKGVIQGFIQETPIGAIKGDTRSVDHSSYEPGNKVIVYSLQVQP